MNDFLRNNKNTSARYTHANGSTEIVNVIKQFSEAEGGDILIYIPSLGREKQTVKERLVFEKKSYNNFSNARKRMFISRHLDKSFSNGKKYYYPEIIVKKNNILVSKIDGYYIKSNILQIQKNLTFDNKYYTLIVSNYSIYFIEEDNLKEYENVKSNYRIAKIGATTLRNGKKKIKITPDMELLDCFESSSNLYVPEDVFNNISNLGLSNDKPIKKVPYDWKLKNDGNGLYLGNGILNSSNIIKSIEKNNIKYYETRTSIYFKI